jgi:carboxyl-terminal processing protease
MKASISYTILIFLSIQFSGCEKMFVDQPGNDPEAIFENLWSTFNEEYAPFDERGVNWDSAYNVYRHMVGTATSDDELFEVLSMLLSVLDDGHVSLTAPDRDVFYSNRYRRELIDDALFDLSVVKDYLEEGYQMDETQSYIYGRIRNENTAYIFFDYVGENFTRLNDFLTDHALAEGYIIDLRHNKGGDFTYCFTEIGQLTDQSRFVFRSRTKNGKNINDFTDWKEWYIHPEGKYIGKPIAVLTDRYTISAGERSVMALRALPNVTIFGDTTNGAHGTMIGRELANGWFYSLVPQQVELYDGRSYEGIGLAPDRYIKNSAEDISKGVDRVLESAIEGLKNN